VTCIGCHPACCTWERSDANTRSNWSYENGSDSKPVVAEGDGFGRRINAVVPDEPNSGRLRPVRSGFE
jgi:hypothetical protein